MVTIATDATLLERLSVAATRGVSVSERRQQRVSFVYGNMPRGSTMTKHQVEAALNKKDATDGVR
jgi:hypothetical protein